MSEEIEGKNTHKPLKSEDEIFSIPEERPTIQLAIKGLELPPESESRLESEVRQLLTKEIDWVRGEQIQETKKISRNNKMNLIVSLEGLALPDE